jgi:hypothetical protein
MTELPEELKGTPTKEFVMSEIEQLIRDDIIKELKENSQEMDDECKKVLYDNLWDLYEDL